ncbi:MAG: hypothetical protein HY270_06705 [Deltaproteobacteria bacterium]|nr:hypothetical protein [Deltaproteobacteria bacterium]
MPTATRTPSVEPTPTATVPVPTATPTNTVPGATSTPTNTASPTLTPTITDTPTVTNTPTITNTPGANVCGGTSVAASNCCNNVVDAGEQCDDGGTCVGGGNGGNPCTDNSNCPSGECRAFGGDGCAANCTNETSIHFAFTGATCWGGAKDGQVCHGNRFCVGGAYVGKACGATTDCGPAANRGVCTSECTTGTDGSECLGAGTCITGNVGTACPANPSAVVPPSTQSICQGGSKPHIPCTSNTDCTGGGTCVNPCGAGTCQNRSGSVLQALGLVVFNLGIGPFTGGQDLIIGGADANGVIPVAVPATSVQFDPVKVPGLACACPRGVAATQVHGPGNAGSGFIGCGAGGLQNTNVNLGRDHNTNPASANNGPGTCNGGARNGLACKTGGTNDCPSGTCVGVGAGGGVCLAGTNINKPCKLDSDCPLSICNSPDDASCTAQDPPPPSGSGEAACLESKDHCTAGPTVGAACTTNAQCGTGGICGNSCNASSVHPGICNSPTHVQFSGSGPAGSSVLLINIGIGVIGPSPTDDGTCKRAAVCVPFTFNQSAAPTSCVVDAECTVGKTCHSAYCAGLCTSGPKIGSSCIKTTDCGTGGFCDQGTMFSQPCTGTIPNECGTNSVCIPVVPAKGFDGLPCTADDPVSSQGTAQSAPTTTGTATASLIDGNNVAGNQLNGSLCSNLTTCVTTLTGTPFNCAALQSMTPTLTGTSLVSGFTQFDAATVNDDVITIRETAK